MGYQLIPPLMLIPIYYEFIVFAKKTRAISIDSSCFFVVGGIYMLTKVVENWASNSYFSARSETVSNVYNRIFLSPARLFSPPRPS